MKTRHRIVRAVAVLGIALGLALATSASGLRTLGVRLIVPLGGMPVLFGIEASTELSFGVGTGAFLLSGDGKTLITLSADVRLSSTSETGSTYLRFTGGIFYFDPSRMLPSLVVGGGLTYELTLGSSIGLGISGEFLYPLAFPVPMLGLSARWIPE
jgi:hypothetical protein